MDEAQQKTIELRKTPLRAGAIGPYIIMDGFAWRSSSRYRVVWILFIITAPVTVLIFRAGHPLFGFSLLVLMTILSICQYKIQQEVWKKLSVNEISKYLEKLDNADPEVNKGRKIYKIIASVFIGIFIVTSIVLVGLMLGN